MALAAAARVVRGAGPAAHGTGLEENARGIVGEDGGVDSGAKGRQRQQGHRGTGRSKHPPRNLTDYLPMTPCHPPARDRPVSLRGVFKTRFGAFFFDVKREARLLLDRGIEPRTFPTKLDSSSRQTSIRPGAILGYPFGASMITAANTLPSATARRRWATAAHAEAAATSPGELSALGAHVDRCNGCRSRWFAIQCAADSLHGFVAPRLVTTVVLVAMVFGVVSIIA